MMRQRTAYRDEDADVALDDQEQEAVVQKLESADKKSSVIIYGVLSTLSACLAVYMLLGPLAVQGFTRRLLLRFISAVTLSAASLSALFCYVDTAAPRRYSWRHRNSPLQHVMQLVQHPALLPSALAVSLLAPTVLEPSAFGHLEQAILLTPALAVGLTWYANLQMGAVRGELEKLRASKYGLRGA